MSDITAIVLAAGASTRMKKQKLLLPFNGNTIVETVIMNILPAVQSVVVVLGSHHDEVRSRIEKLPVTICVNENYTAGMLSSAICGFRTLAAETKAALIFLGDQPLIPPSVTQQVIEAWRKSEKGIVVPAFNGKKGHPVLIETRFKPEIEKLNPENGLRQLMSKFENEVYQVECDIPEILRDIDTPEDYKFEINLKSI